MLRSGRAGFRLFTGTYYRGLDYVQVRPAHAYILSAYPRVRRVMMLAYSVDVGALERSRIHTLQLVGRPNVREAKFSGSLRTSCTCRIEKHADRTRKVYTSL